MTQVAPGVSRPSTRKVTRPLAERSIQPRRRVPSAWTNADGAVTKVGGISEERRIAWMARDHGVRFIPHGWNTAVGLAADLQLASAFPETDLVEYLDGSPFIDEIVADPWRLDAGGMLQIPDAPGLGLKFNPDAVGKYTHGERLFD